jgi:hypothetical protein
MSPQNALMFLFMCHYLVALNGVRKCSKTSKQDQQTELPEPALNAQKPKKPHLSPSQSPVIVDGAVNAPRDTAEPPKVCDDCERDEGEEDVLGALREAPSGEDKVVEQVGGHQNGKVERRELGCRC